MTFVAQDFEIFTNLDALARGSTFFQKVLLCSCQLMYWHKVQPIAWPRCFNLLAGSSLVTDDRHQTWFGEGIFASCLVNAPTSFHGILAFRTINRHVFYRLHSSFLPKPWSLAAKVFRNSMNEFRIFARYRNCDVLRCIKQLHRACRALRTVFIMEETEMQVVHAVEHEYFIAMIREHIRRFRWLSNDNNCRLAGCSLKSFVLITRAFSISSRERHCRLDRLTVDDSRMVQLPAYTAGYISAIEGFATEVHALGSIMDVLPQETFAMHAPFSAEAIRHFSNQHTRRNRVTVWDSLETQYDPWQREILR